LTFIESRSRLVTGSAWHSTLYCPTNAHNVKNVELLNHFKIKKAAPTYFGLKENHHQGATDST